MTLKPGMFASLAVLAFVMAALLLINEKYHLFGGHGRVVDGWIARNVAARGGADAWRGVSSMRLSGLMDLGQGMRVPYTLDRKRPGKMCLEFEFDEQMAVQCVAEGAGWASLPFRGRTEPQPLSEQELREMAAMAEIDGLLFDSVRRGHEIEYLGKEIVDDNETVKFEVTLPNGAKRWVYLDVETALEVRVDAMRTLRGQERRVETHFYIWQETNGLLIPRLQETQTEGDPEKHFLTVDSVELNLPMEDARFRIPATRSAANDPLMERAG